MNEFKIIRKYLINRMTSHLENACGNFAIGDRTLARYYAGMADGIRDVLEEWFDWDIVEADEHVKNMQEIIDEEWCK